MHLNRFLIPIFSLSHYLQFCTFLNHLEHFVQRTPHDSAGHVGPESTQERGGIPRPGTDQGRQEKT